MSRVMIEDLSVERTLGVEESQVRGGGVKVKIGIGGGHSHRRRHRRHGHHDHDHHDVWFHDTSHWDYVPGAYVWHGDHYHYIPGHWEYHETGHFHR